MQNDYIDFKFGDHWASEFNLLAVSSSDRYTPPVYGNVNPNIATIMGKKGVYKWKTQVNEKIFNINIAFDSVTIAQLNQIKQWLQPNKIQKLIFSEEPYKYYWAALNAEIDFSHLPFVEGEKQVGERTIIEGVYKGEMVISFVCIDNDGYSIEGTFEGLETENSSSTIKGNDFVLTDADNDYIDNLKIEGKSEQETKYNNTLSDTDFADVNSRSVEKTWKTNNLAQIQAKNGEVTISAPYQYSGIAQEQREALIDHKYFASVEINTDSLDTALEIAGKNITNSIEGKDINITDGLVGPVDDLIVSGDASQDKLYNNEINSSFLENLDNWNNQNNGQTSINKQKATVIANEKYDGVSQRTEENNIGDKYYVRAKVQSNNTETALEVETEKGSAEGSSITINDASDNKLENIRIEGKHSQEHYDQKDLGEGEIISYNNADNYERYTKISVSGNSAQEVVEEVPGTEVEGDNLTVNGITVTNKELDINGNVKQDVEEDIKPSSANLSKITVLGQNTNLFNVTDSFQERTVIGLTFTPIENSSIIKVNGTATSDKTSFLGKELEGVFEIGKTYYGYTNNENFEILFELYGTDVEVPIKTVSNFTMSSEYRKINLVLKGTNLNGKTYDNEEIGIKIEEGKITNYTPYGQGSCSFIIANGDKTQKQEFILPIQKPMLKEDYFDFKNKKEIHHWSKTTFTGEEKWALNATYTNTIRFSLGVSYLNANKIGYCNRSFIRTTQAHGDYEYMFYSSDLLYFNISKSSLPADKQNLEGFTELLKQWDSEGEPLELYYQTGEVEELTLTDEQIAVGQEIDKAKLYLGTTRIYSNDEIAPYFTLVYNHILPSPSPEVPSEIQNIRDSIKIKLSNQDGSKTKQINFPLSEGQKLMKGDYLTRDGIHHKRKQVELDGTEKWVLYKSNEETGVYIFYSQVSDLYGESSTQRLLSNLFAWNRGVDFYNNVVEAYKIGNVGTGTKNIYISVKEADAKTVTEFKSYLSNLKTVGTPLTVEYELTEEEIEEYTETQKEIYNNLTHLIMYNGQNTLTSSNELKPQLKWEIPESPSPDYPIEIKTVNNDLIVTSTNGENEKQNIDIDVQKDLLEGDYLDLNDNVESHSWNYKELNGTENWQENMNYTTSTLLVVQLEIENINLLVQDGLCTHFKYNNDNTTPNTFKVTENNLLIIKLNKSEFATLEKFKSWLVQQKEKNSVKIYWKMNIIQNLSLTSNQKTELQKIKSYREITKISSNNALQPNIKVEYIKKPLHTTKLTGNTEQLLSLIYQTNINKTKILLNNISNNNNTFTFTHPILINLTKQFGSGKEPTKEWLDTNIDFWSVAEGGAPSVETSSRIKTVGSNINLFDPDNHIELDGQYRHYSKGKIVNSANFFGIKIPVLGNMVYGVNSNFSRNGYSNLCYYDKDFTFMWGEPFTEGQTFRTPFNCRYITLALNKNYDWFTLTYGEIPIQKADYNLANIDMQISGYDNQFKSFPLAKNQELLQLPNGTQDTLEADGIHKRVEKIIINGTENWLKQNGVNHKKTWRFIFNRTNGSLSSAKNNCYCDKFINYSADDLWNEDIEGIAVSKSQVIIRINSEKAENVVELKRLLQDNNLVLYLPKVSEEIIPYSNAQKAWYDDFEIYRKNTQITTIAETKPWYSFTYDINDTYSVNSTKVNEYEKLGLIFNNLEDRPRFIVNRTTDGSGTIKMRKPLVVDLTNIFGAGKEPDLAWCLKNITFDNSCEYGTPSPNVPSELVSVGSNPIKIENKSKNLIKEQNLLNWTKEYCTVERLTEKYDNRNIYRISFENHKKGIISTRIQQKKGDMVLSIYARVIQADDPTVNRLAVAKVTSDSSASTVVSHKSLENLIGEWQKIYIPITAESISDAAELVLEVQHNADTDDSTIIDLCMPQLEEGFTPHDYIPYAPEKVNNLTFTTPLRQLKNGVRDEFSKDGIIRRIGEHTIKSSDEVYWIVFNQDKSYVTICGQLGIYVRGDNSWDAPSFYCNRIEDCTSLYRIAQAKSPAPSRTKEGIGIIDSEYRMCLRADLMGIVETDTEEDMIRKYKVLLDEKPFTIYYEKEVADIEPLTELQKNTLANLVTRKQYDHWLISGDLNPEVELSYKLSSSINDIHPWVTGSNLLDKTWFYNDNNIHTKPYVEVDTGDADKSGISATRPIYLLNSGTETANLSLTFDYINIETPLTIQTYSGKFTDDGFVEEAKVSEITIEPFTNYQPFKDIYDNNPANWKIEIDSTLGEVYLRHNTDETKVLNLNRFNKDHTFLSLADCNFVDYDKVFPTIISEIEGTAIENTIFNKVIIANTADNYRLKNVNIEWKHTYL